MTTTSSSIKWFYFKQTIDFISLLNQSGLNPVIFHILPSGKHQILYTHESCCSCWLAGTQGFRWSSQRRRALHESKRKQRHVRQPLWRLLTADNLEITITGRSTATLCEPSSLSRGVRLVGVPRAPGILSCSKCELVANSAVRQG